MSDKTPSYAKIVIVSIVVSALVSTSFGFVAGFVASQTTWSENLMAILPSTVRQFVPTPKPESGEQKYSLPEIRDQIKPTSAEDKIVKVVEQASPAVVSIVISKDMPTYEQYMDPNQGGDFFSQFFQGFPGFNTPQYRQNGTEKQEIGAGTGFLVSADGYIVTNKHVVSDTAAEYTVVMSDDKKFVAKVVARDPGNDLAVLKIEGSNLPYLKMGDSDQIRVGQSIIAIGYALGQFGNSVSVGIVSGLGRQITAGDRGGASESLFDVIQTDAGINPGNSGGPLLNVSGEVIGVNVAIVQGAQSISFSLPINDVKRVVSSVQTTGKIVRPWIGLRYVMVNSDIKKSNNLTVDYGALVVRGERPVDLAVMPGSPADKLGLVENDIILEAGGVKLTEEMPLGVALGRHNPGDKVSLKVMHRGEIQTMEITLAERPEM